MNLRNMVKMAERFLKKKNIKKAKESLDLAEGYLKQMDPDGNAETPFICCVMTNVETGIIHCGKSDDKPLFPGTIKERIVLCKECRNWCRQKIQELKKEIKKAR